MRKVGLLLALAAFMVFTGVPAQAQGRVNTASAEQMTKLGLDEATQKKIVAGRPYTGLDDAKLKESIPADVLTKLEGKVTVKPPPAK